eukprot:contig_5894_g1332
MSSSKRPAQLEGDDVVPTDRCTGKQAKVMRRSPTPVRTDSGGSGYSAADEQGTSADSSSESGGELDSSDDPDKVAYNRPGMAGRASAAAPTHVPSITSTSGDAVLRAAVCHAVLALGEYKVWSAGRRTGRSKESEQDDVNVPDVFVVGQRPQRSVRLLLAMSRGAWVVSDSWFLASVGSRACKPCGAFVPAAFPEVAAARTAYATGESLLRGMRIGFGGGLRIETREFVQPVESAGGVFGNRDESVIVLGSAYSPEARVRVGSAQYVNQRWLPDSIARWALQPYTAYVAE